MAAATGKLISVDRMSFNVPTDWTREPAYIGRGVAVGANGSGIVITVGVSTPIEPNRSLVAFARSWREHGLYVKKPKIVDEISIGGQSWFHLSGDIGLNTYGDDYGTVVGGDTEIVFSVETLNEFVPAAERKQTIDSILASVVLS